MATWTPRLRADVTCARGEAGQPLLVDLVFRRRVDLGPTAMAVVESLDGRRGAEEVTEAVVSRLQVARHSVAESLRTLLLMNLLEGAGDDIVARARRFRAGARPLVVQALPESRFVCQGSGDCCQSFGYGPLPAEEVERLEALEPDLRAAYPHLPPGPYVEPHRGDGGQVDYFLRSQHDRCIFLLDDCRCGLHAAFGAAAKPALCRQFPLAALPTLYGVRVFDRGECAAYATSARAGPPLLDQGERLLQLLPPDFDYDRDLHHPLVFLDEHTPCDYGHFLALQEGLCALVEGGAGSATIAGTLVALSRMVRAFVEEVGACRLAEGEPDRTVREVVSPPWDRYLRSDPDQGLRGLFALIPLLSELMQEIEFRVARARAEDPTTRSFRDARRLSPVAQVLRLAVAERAGVLGYPMPAEVARVLAVDFACLEHDALLRLSLRQQLFGARMLLKERPQPALLRLLLAYLLTVYGAKHHAAERGATRVAAEDFNAGHLMAQRTLRQQDATPIFLSHAAQVFAVAEAVPLLM